MNHLPACTIAVVVVHTSTAGICTKDHCLNWRRPCTPTESTDHSHTAEPFASWADLQEWLGPHLRRKRHWGLGPCRFHTVAAVIVAFDSSCTME